MFALEFEHTHKVLLTRFSGMLLPDDIRALNEAVRQFVHDHGHVRGLLDFSGVNVVAIPESFFRLPPGSPQISLVFVASQEEVLAVARRHAGQQRDHGNTEIAIVPTLAEAYEILNIEAPNFVALHAFTSHRP